MARHFPGFRYQWKRNNIVWSGSLRPTFESPEYSARIVHKFNSSPKVFIDAPSINPKAEHLYSDRSLCLYYPKEWSWSSERKLATSIVPWTALWLYYYEIWLFCGEWLGPSVHGESKGPGDG